jgi:uncharacterized protein YacL
MILDKNMKMDSKFQGYLVILVWSLLGGLFIAYSYAVTADGRVEFDILTRPAVFPIAMTFGIVFGLIISPLVFICLRNRNLLISVPVIVMLVAVLTACLNVAAAPRALGLPGSFILTSILLLWRRFGPEIRPTTKSNNRIERDA